ncbi:MAG: HEAT repeat domain-containing protein [Planctomycetota bacterium]
MLVKEDSSDAARYALERISGAKVDQVLRDSLGKTSGKARIGIINTIGMRGDKKGVKALSKLIHESDPETVSAVAASLGQIGGNKAAKILSAAKKNTEGRMRVTILDAYLKCADKMMAEGRKQKAMAIYKELYIPSEPKGIRVAALKGLVVDFGAKDIISIFKGDDDAAIQTVAAELISDTSPSGKGRVRKVVAKMSAFSVTARVQLITSLTRSEDTEFVRPIVIKAVNDKEKDIRVAALSALEILGDAESVSLVAASAASSAGEEQKAAQQSLVRMRGPGIDNAITELISSSKPKVKVELIRVVGQRKIIAAADTLLATTQDKNKQVRIESYRSLKTIAEPSYLPALVDLLVLIKNQAERDEAEKTISALAQKITDANRRAEAVLSKLSTVKKTSVKCSLLRVLGKIQDDSALDVLTSGLKDKQENVRYTCIKALSDWPNIKPSDSLLDAAKNSKNKVHRILALRGYINMAGLAVKESPSKAFEMYKTAMSMASRADEKKMVLSGIANVHTPEALDLVLDHLKDRSLKEEVRIAGMAIAAAIKPTHQEKAEKAIDQIQKVLGN